LGDVRASVRGLLSIANVIQNFGSRLGPATNWKQQVNRRALLHRRQLRGDTRQTAGCAGTLYVSTTY
jgi:hypothetical protein